MFDALFITRRKFLKFSKFQCFFSLIPFVMALASSPKLISAIDISLLRTEVRFTAGEEGKELQELDIVRSWSRTCCIS